MTLQWLILLIIIIVVGALCVALACKICCPNKNQRNVDNEIKDIEIGRNESKRSSLKDNLKNHQAIKSSSNHKEYPKLAQDLEKAVNSYHSSLENQRNYKIVGQSDIKINDKSSNSSNKQLPKQNPSTSRTRLAPNKNNINPLEESKKDSNPSKSIVEGKRNDQDSLKTIIIDGQNVGVGHTATKAKILGEDPPYVKGKMVLLSARGIEICVQYFQQRGHQKIRVILPAYRLQKNMSEDQSILLKLERRVCS